VLSITSPTAFAAHARFLICSSAMRQLQPVLWSKGTLLSPQHLQLQDRYIEDALQFRLESLTFEPWGFRTLRLDAEALAAGGLAVSSASGILPDGLMFDVPGADEAPEPKLLAPLFQQGVDTLDLYLAAPARRQRGVNVASGSGSADTRYTAEVAFVRDEVHGASEKPVQVARKNLRLLGASESLQGSSSMRIARVTRGISSGFELERSFVPPLLDIAANERIMSVVRGLMEQLGARSTELASTRREGAEGVAGFTSADILTFWMLHTVNSFYPELRHTYETRRGHPSRLYSVLLALAGGLTTFSADVHPRDLPAYDHNNLGECFSDLHQKIRLLLQAGLAKNFVALPLNQVQPSVYAANLADERVFAGGRFYLGIAADMDRGELIGRAPKALKVCSLSHIDQLLRLALPGVTLTHVPRPPAALPVKLQFEYFSLTQAGPPWEAILRSHNIAAWVPGELPNPQLEVVILLPEGAPARLSGF
jgi:type VI secretion system protein ImpJ